MPRPSSFPPFPVFPACVVFCLALAALAAAAAPPPGGARVRSAVFSDRQLFWPQLAGLAPASSVVKSAAAGNAPGKDKIAILPISIKDYRESLSCDSCHRLSANGMEFFLENYLKDKLAARFPAKTVELIAPNQPLLESKLDLMSYLDGIAVPWDKWLSDSGDQVVYRPHDRATDPAARKRLDRLGGMLGAAYLLLPARMRVRVAPRSTTSHQGGLEWTFALLLWNVAAGTPEWAMEYSERSAEMDLDEALDSRLDKGLVKAWDRLPDDLKSLWNAEPR